MTRNTRPWPPWRLDHFSPCGAAGRLAPRDSALRSFWLGGRDDRRPIAEERGRVYLGDVAEILANPKPHVGKVYELTEPRSEDMNAIAAEYSEALGRKISYLDVPPAAFRDELRAYNLPEHVYHHLAVMAQLHAENRYDRLTHDVDALLGRPATSVRAYVAKHPELWRAQRTPAVAHALDELGRIAFNHNEQCKKRIPSS